MDLIGQFGVGFYSAYLVADKVTVLTRSFNKGDDGRSSCSNSTLCWESNAGGSYHISELVDGEDVGFPLEHGTRILLHLKEDASEFIEESRIREVIKKHSQFVNYPIELFTVREEEVEVEGEVKVDGEVETGDDSVVDGEAETGDDSVVDGEVVDGEDDEDDEDDDDDDDDKPVIEEVEIDLNGNEKVKEEEKKVMQKKKVREWDVLNKDKPVWCRSESEVTEEEHESFYKNISGDEGGVLGHKHFSTEGSMEFKGIIYIPKRAPFDMFQKNEQNKDTMKFKLYAKRVFIMDNCKELVPEWLRFIGGVVDSYDLPLNVSRELLQQNKVISVMRKRIISKTIDLLRDIYEDEEKRDSFYSQFSKNLKLGVYEEEKHREKLAGLLRFYTTTSGNNMRGLDEYIETMKEGQKSVYYLAGESMESVQHSVFLEALRAKGYEVLFMVDTIDEYMVQQLKTYKDYEFISVAQEGLNFGDEDNKTSDGDAKADKDGDAEEDKDGDAKADKDGVEGQERNKELCTFFKNTLGDRVERVVVSKRIVQSPVCLVSGKFGWSANMERIMTAQAFGDNHMHQFMKSRKIMEINPNHKVIQSMYRKYGMNKEDRSLKDSVLLLYDVACMSCGFKVENVDVFSNTFYKILDVGLGGFDGVEESGDGVNEEVNEEVSEEVNEEVSEEVNEEVNEEVSDEIDDDSVVVEEENMESVD